MTSEDDLIARFFAPLAGPAGLGLLDDAATLVPPAGQDLVVTTDGLVGGVHFFVDDAPASVARKCLAVNLSDLASKGADPLGFVMTLALPSGWTADWLAAFAAGIGAESTAGGCPLIGGDTVSTPGPLSVSVTAFGTVPSGRMVRRTGARAGDRLYVSGTIGDAALGLRLRLGEVPALDDGAREHLLDRYLHPRPRLALRSALLAHAGGAMDVSDGFVGDLRKMMRASGTTASVDLAKVPLSPAVRSAIAEEAELFDAAMTGGDDYEILASVPVAAAAAFERDAADAGVPVVAVGTVMEGHGPVTFSDRGGDLRVFARGAYSHF